MPTKIVPSNVPQIGIDKVKSLIKSNINCQLLGIRGYYKDTMGETGRNDIGIYDDAIILITPNVFAAFNANVDPSIRRPKIATLVPGTYWYKIGIHGLSKPPARRYKALVQQGAVTVSRQDGDKETGFFGINIHKGGYSTTSSEGCQTIYPDQWNNFITTVESELNRMSQKTIPYTLVEY